MFPIAEHRKTIELTIVPSNSQSSNLKENKVKGKWEKEEIDPPVDKDKDNLKIKETSIGMKKGIMKMKMEEKERHRWKDKDKEPSIKIGKLLKVHFHLAPKLPPQDSSTIVRPKKQEEHINQLSKLAAMVLDLTKISVSQMFDQFLEVRRKSNWKTQEYGFRQRDPLTTTVQ